MEITAELKRRSRLVQFVIRLLKEKPLGTVGALIVLLFLMVGIFANLISPYGMNATSLKDALSPPSATHVLGTDQLGRDLLTRVIFGARISMIVGVIGSALSVVLSTIIGGLSGFIGGKFDILVQRFVDAWMSFPAFVLLLTVMSLLGPGLWNVVLVLALSYGVGGSRIVRGTVMVVKQNVYVEAARSIGCPTWRLLIGHVLVNSTAPIIVLFTTRMGSMILDEAALSFLGFGVPPPQPSWGGMLSLAGRQYVLVAPWMVIWPGLSLSLVVYGVNMFGDALRDLLDPRLRGGLGRYDVKVKKTVRVKG